MHYNIFLVESFNMIWSMRGIKTQLKMSSLDLADPVCVFQIKVRFVYKAIILSTNTIENNSTSNFTTDGKTDENDGIKCTKTADECEKYLNGKRFIVSHTQACVVCVRDRYIYGMGK